MLYTNSLQESANKTSYACYCVLTTSSRTQYHFPIRNQVLLSEQYEIGRKNLLKLERHQCYINTNALNTELKANLPSMLIGFK